MCGIFGILSSKAIHGAQRTKKYTDFLGDATITSSVRGFNSTGLMMVTRNKNMEIFKRAIAPWNFLETAKAQSIYTHIDDYSAIIGHVRAPTRGATTLDNTHPFHHRNIMMVHNGTLNGVMSLGFNSWVYETDSEHIAKALSDADKPEDVLSKINGTFALAWYDNNKKSVFLSRNKERDLHFVHSAEDDVILIASEWKMLEWLAERNNIAIKQEEIFSVSPMTYIEFPLDDVGKYKVTKFEEYKEPVVTRYVANRIPFVGGRGAVRPKTYEVISKPADIARRGYIVGQKIDFQQMSIFLSRPNSKAGIVEGVMLERPWCFVRAMGVDIRKVMNKNKYSMVGSLEAILDGADSHGPIFILRNVTVQEKNPRTIVNFPIKHNKSVGLYDISLHKDVNAIPAIELPDGNKAEQSLIKGPHGGLITEEAFNFLTKHGCAFCNSDLFIKDAPKLSWIESAPVCLTCQNELEKKNMH